jgi:hypothetical protein
LVTQPLDKRRDRSKPNCSVKVEIEKPSNWKWYHIVCAKYFKISNASKCCAHKSLR